MILNPALCSPASLSHSLFLSSMDGGDADFLKTVSGLGCEIHSFDPSNANASGGHLGNSLVSNHGERGVVTQHKMWLEWRAPRKRKHRARGALGSVSQTLADIMAALGHHTVRHTHRNTSVRPHTHTHTCRKLSETVPNIPYCLLTPKLLLLCSHSNRALRHPWLPWKQSKRVIHTSPVAFCCHKRELHAYSLSFCGHI